MLVFHLGVVLNMLWVVVKKAFSVASKGTAAERAVAERVAAWAAAEEAFNDTWEQN